MSLETSTYEPPRPLSLLALPLSLPPTFSSSSFVRNERLDVGLGDHDTVRIAVDLANMNLNMVVVKSFEKLVTGRLLQRATLFDAQAVPLRQHRQRVSRQTKCGILLHPNVPKLANGPLESSEKQKKRRGYTYFLLHPLLQFTL